MCSAQVSKPHRTAGLSGPPAWRVVAVHPLPAFCLQVRFQDGTSGVVDLSVLLAGESAGVFAALREPGMFESVRIEHGTVAWPNEIDLAPDAMYAAIKAEGRCVLA